MYIVQGILSDRVIIEVNFDLESEALDRAEALVRDRTFEGNLVRVITMDGELVIQYDV